MCVCSKAAEWPKKQDKYPLQISTGEFGGGGREGGLENRKEHNKLLGGIDISAELCNLEKSSRVKTGSRECSRQAEEQVHKVADANGNSSMLLEWICKGDDQS